MKKKLVLLASVLAGGGLQASASAEEISYRQHIKPLWEQHCASCHGDNAPDLGLFKERSQYYEENNLGPRMSDYANLTAFVVWPETGALMRRLDDGDGRGQPGNMYQYLGEDEAERQANLRLFKAWVGEDAWFKNRWNPRGDVPGVTKEQLDRLKLAY